MCTYGTQCNETVKEHKDRSVFFQQRFNLRVSHGAMFWIQETIV